MSEKKKKKLTCKRIEAKEPGTIEYAVGDKHVFIVEPVYKESGPTIYDILLNLMLKDIRDNGIPEQK